MCLISHNINFSVWLDDEKIYDYNPQLGGIYGTRYGEEIHVVTLPSFLEQRELRIEGIPLRFDNSSGCNDVYLQNSQEFSENIFRQSGVKLGFCVSVLGFGIVLLLVGYVGIVKRTNLKQMLETICLGMIAITVSVWVASQMNVIRLISPNSALFRIIEYVSLDLIPIPFIMFIALFTEKQNMTFVKVSLSLSSLKLLISFVLSSMDVIDYSEVLFITHILIIINAIIGIWMIVKNIRNNKTDSYKNLAIITSISILGISAICDTIRYYLSDDNYDVAFLSVLGLMIFIVILSFYELRKNIDIQIQSNQLEMMKIMAMKDSLTGLGSRAAFVEYEKQIQNRSSGICLFVLFDVNNLKQVNDIYGHIEGDRHLMNAANILKSSFETSGSIFRIGGDEFMVVLDRESCKKDYEEAIAKMEEAQETFNSTQNPFVPLKIAYGMAEHNCVDGNPQKAEKLADSRMYEKKKQMKKMMASTI